MGIVYLALAGIMAGLIANRLLRPQCPQKVLFDVLVGTAAAIATGIIFSFFVGISVYQPSVLKEITSFAVAMVVLYAWCMIRVDSANRVVR